MFVTTSLSVCLLCVRCRPFGVIVASNLLSLPSDRKKCDSSIVVPPLSFAKDSLFHSVFIIPEQMEQCVFATEVKGREHLWFCIFQSLLNRFFVYSAGLQIIYKQTNKQTEL